MARSGQEFSTAGSVLTVLTLPVMWLLARKKLRLADQRDYQDHRRRVARVFGGDGTFRGLPITTTSPNRSVSQASGSTRRGEYSSFW